MSEASIDLICEPDAIRLMAMEHCEKYRVIPIRKAGAKLFVATSEPNNLLLQDELRFLTQYDIEFVTTTVEAIERAITRCYREAPIALQPHLDAVPSDKTDEALIRCTHVILLNAIKRKQQFVAIEPGGLWIWRGGWKREEVTAPREVFTAISRRFTIHNAHLAELPPDGDTIWGGFNVNVGAKQVFHFLFDALNLDGEMRFVFEQVTENAYKARAALEEFFAQPPRHEPVPGWPSELGDPYR